VYSSGVYDLLLHGGTVVDGSGRPGFRADVAVEGGRIVALGSLEGAAASEALDITGLAVCPGFIDMHSHSDTPLLVDGRGLSKVHQGVTTEVIGNCGSSPAPLTDNAAAVVTQMHGTAGRAVAELPWDWRRFGDFLGRLEGGGIGLNVIALAGHSTLRAVSMGFDRRQFDSHLGHTGLGARGRRAAPAGAAARPGYPRPPGVRGPRPGARV